MIYGGLIILAAFTIYPYVMDFMFGKKCSEAIFYYQIIMCSLVIGNVANLNFAMYAHKKTVRVIGQSC